MIKESDVTYLSKRQLDSQSTPPTSYPPSRVIRIPRADQVSLVEVYWTCQTPAAMTPVYLHEGAKPAWSDLLHLRLCIFAAMLRLA